MGGRILPGGRRGNFSFIADVWVCRNPKCFACPGDGSWWHVGFDGYYRRRFRDAEEVANYVRQHVYDIVSTWDTPVPPAPPAAPAAAAGPDLEGSLGG